MTVSRVCHCALLLLFVIFGNVSTQETSLLRVLNDDDTWSPSVTDWDDVYPPANQWPLLVEYPTDLSPLDSELGSISDNSVDLQQDIQSELRDLSGHCNCQKNNCGCCQQIDVKIIHFRLKSKVCIDVSYLPQEIGIAMKVTYNSHTVFEEKISARNPPPICFKQPITKFLKTAICIRLYDIRIEGRKLHSCARIELKILKKVAKFKLGCFDVGNASLIKNNESNSWIIAILGKKEIQNQSPTIVMIH